MHFILRLLVLVADCLVLRAGLVLLRVFMSRKISFAPRFRFEQGLDRVPHDDIRLAAPGPQLEGHI